MAVAYLYINNDFDRLIDTYFKAFNVAKKLLKSEGNYDKSRGLAILRDLGIDALHNSQKLSDITLFVEAVSENNAPKMKHIKAIDRARRATTKMKNLAKSWQTWAGQVELKDHLTGI